MPNAFTSRFNLFPHALTVAVDDDPFHRHDHRRKDNEGATEGNSSILSFRYTVYPGLCFAAGIRSWKRRVGGNQRQTKPIIELHKVRMPNRWLVLAQSQHEAGSSKEPALNLHRFTSGLRHRQTNTNQFEA